MRSTFQYGLFIFIMLLNGSSLCAAEDGPKTKVRRQCW